MKSCSTDMLETGVEKLRLDDDAEDREEVEEREADDRKLSPSAKPVVPRMLSRKCSSSPLLCIRTCWRSWSLLCGWGGFLLSRKPGAMVRWLRLLSRLSGGMEGVVCLCGGEGRDRDAYS